MNEIANCPLCGKNVKQSIWRPEYEGCGGSVVVTLRCCGIEAASIQLWNQYAAAMELARARSAYEKAPHLGDEETQELWDDVTATTKRVLEVFGGE